MPPLQRLAVRGPLQVLLHAAFFGEGHLHAGEASALPGPLCYTSACLSIDLVPAWVQPHLHYMSAACTLCWVSRAKELW